MISKEQLNDWRKWLLDDTDNRIADDLLMQVFAQAEVAIELQLACRKLLAISLPSDVSGNRMRQEAINTITKADKISIAPKGGSS